MICREMSLALTLTGIAIKWNGRSIFFGKQRGVVSLHWLQNKTIQNILDLVLGNKYRSGYGKSDNEKTWQSSYKAEEPRAATNLSKK